MDKKKALILGGVGIASALGLGWMLSRLVKGNGNGGNGGDTCSSGYHYDEELGGCVPDDIPIDPTLDMSPEAIWERAHDLFSSPQNLVRPPVRATSFNFTANASVGPKTPVYNKYYWLKELDSHADSIRYQTDYPEPFCADNPTCDQYLDGSTYCDYQHRGPGTRIGQLVYQDDAWNEGIWWTIYRWDGSNWVAVWNNYLSIGADDNDREINSYDVGRADITLLSTVDYLIPPDMIILGASVADPRDSEMIRVANGFIFTGWAPGPDFMVADISTGDPADRSTWLNLKAGVPYTLEDVTVRAYARAPYRNTRYAAGDFDAPGSAYQGGKVPSGEYTAHVTVGFPKVCIMKYNVNWYEPPTTEADYYPGDEVDPNSGLPTCTVYEEVASFSIGQAEVLSDTLRFWHWKMITCSCDQDVQLYLPEGQCTAATPAEFTISYPFTEVIQ